jgi:hypothetical protein
VPLLEIAKGEVEPPALIHDVVRDALTAVSAMEVDVEPQFLTEGDLRPLPNEMGLEDCHDLDRLAADVGQDPRLPPVIGEALLWVDWRVDPEDISKMLKGRFVVLGDRQHRPERGVLPAWISLDSNDHAPLAVNESSGPPQVFQFDRLVHSLASNVTREATV